MPDNSVYIKVC